MLNKKQILECSDIESEVVKVPEWDGQVMVYGLTNGEKDDFENSLVSKDAQTGKRSIDMKYASARLCSMCIRDEDGNNVFDQSDVIALSKKSGRAVQRIYDVAEKLSGLGDGAVKEMVKNSEKTPTSDSD
jgi:hypothetical protein